MDPELEDAARRAAKAVGDAVADVATVAVGLGVLGINRLQALRREITDRVQRPDS